MSSWEELASWWLDELDGDPIYRLDVIPLAGELIGEPLGIALDLGCGEGQVMRTLPGFTVGTDISLDLLRHAVAAGPVVRGRLPRLDWVRSATVEVAYAVLVLEHLADLELFDAAFRIVRPGGHLVVIANHPAFTAADAGPILDQSDGEFLWRWGRYFEKAQIAMRTTAGEKVAFHHRPLATILNAAADAGWALDRFVETGLSPAAVAVRPGYVGQEQMPRLVGMRWSRPPPCVSTINTQDRREVGR